MKLLHVVNGDTVRTGLEACGLDGQTGVYADVLHEGPVPADFGASAMAIRARFLARSGYALYDDALDQLRNWQAPLDHHADHDEIVLWLEHDLFDQLLLIRHLAFFERAGRRDGLSLVQADTFLGVMMPAELGALLPRRVAVTSAQLATGARAWAAFTDADAGALAGLLETDLGALPFLRVALLRFAEEYPAADDGLGRTERQVLMLLAERARPFAELFHANAKLEEAAFLSDAVLRARLHRLAAARVPLITPGLPISITDAGRDVLAGRKNAVALNGVNRWYGGVHVQLAAQGP